jgi:hypothetical protein
MKAFISFYILAIVLVGLSCKEDNEEPVTKNGTATIKIFKNNQLVAEYKDEDVTAMKDEDMLLISIISDDDDHTLSITLIDPEKGTFPIDYNYERNGARVHLISTVLASDLSLIIFPEGTVTVEEYSAKTIKGKIEANGLPGISDGAVFSITGTFTAAIYEI